MYLDLKNQVIKRRALDFGCALLIHLHLEETRGDKTKAHAVLNTSGTTRALYASRLRRPVEAKAFELGVGVAVNFLGEAKVDDVAHIWHGDGRLGNVGRNDNLAHARLSRAEDLLLFLAVHGRVKRQDDEGTLEICVVHSLVDEIVQLQDLCKTWEEDEDGAKTVVILLVIGGKLVAANAQNQLDRGLKHFWLYLWVTHQLTYFFFFFFFWIKSF